MALGALSRRDLILSCIAIFIAWGYLVHWFPSLRWTIHCLVLGLIASPCIILYLVLTTSRVSHFANRNISVRPKGLAFMGRREWAQEVLALSKRQLYQRKSLYPPSFLISSALDEILDLIQRDFVKSWYNSISPNPSFANQVDLAIRTALSNIRDRLLGLDLTAVVTERFIPILTAHLRDFYDAERAVRGKHLNRNVTESEELDLAVAGKFRHGKLHPAASLAFSDLKLAQQAHMRKVTKGLLPKVLGEDVVGSRAVCVLVEELVSCAVLAPVVQILGDPDTWNQIIEAYGRSMLKDRSTVRKLRAALDEHAAPVSRTGGVTNFPKLGPNDNERRFEKFVRATRKVNNLSDARRFRSVVSSQLKRDANSQDATYLRRLDVGKRILDQRVDQLAGIGLGLHNGEISKPRLQRSMSVDLTIGTSKLETGTLVDLLRDTSGLSYFMEYMDRQHMMPMVQFWIVVDGFRNPLEGDATEDDDLPSTLPTWTDADRADLAQIHEAYLSRPELSVSDTSKKAVQDFLRAGKTASPEQYFIARRAILGAQSTALEKMNIKYFPGFKKSDLYYKCLTSQEASSQKAAPGSTNPFDGGSNEGSPARPTVRHASTTQTVSPRPGQTSRLSSQYTTGKVDLRRNASSSTDLSSVAHRRQLSDLTSPPRRSLDNHQRFSSLFGTEDEGDDQGLSNSVRSLEPAGDDDLAPDQNVVQKVEAALNNIMENTDDMDELRGSLFGDVASPAASLLLSPVRDNDSPRGSLDSGRLDFFQREGKPSISSLGLVNTSSRIGVFTDDDLFPDEEKFISDEHEDPESEHEADPEDEIHEAAPGDLGLAEAITVLTIDIDRLTAQNAIIDSLTRKAELTNNTAELRILRKSHSSLIREIRRKELQRQQYVVQESDNSLHGRSTVRIHKILVGKDEEKREFALYVIEVHRKAGEQMPTASWVVKKRYSEFHDLHQKLRERYPSVRHLDFPRRRAIMNFSTDFLQKRRAALETYLRELLHLPDVCRDRDLRSFLSQSAIAVNGEGSARQDKKDMMTRFYNSVQDGMEDFLGNIPVLDQLSSAGQNLMSQLAVAPSLAAPLTPGDVLTNAETEAELSAFENQALEPFVKPICDIFLEVFELNRGNNWLRGRAVVVVLHQLLGGTIEKKVRENVKGMVAEEAILKYVGLLKASMWEEGEGTGGKRKESKPRTAAEKIKSRHEAGLCLATLIPDLVGGVVGRVNAQAASRRIFATLNNPRLNTHLAYTIFDEVMDVLFGNVQS